MLINVGIWDDRIQCCVQRLEYDYLEKVGRIYVPYQNVPDFKVTRIFEAIDPGVLRVRVYRPTRESYDAPDGPHQLAHTYARNHWDHPWASTRN